MRTAQPDPSIPTEGTAPASVPKDARGEVQQFVGAGRALQSVLRRRVMFVTRFVYWTFKHGTYKHAGWVCNYEGLWW